MEQNDFTLSWMRGIPYEIAFWNNVFRWTHTYNGLMNWSKFGSVIELEGYDANAELKDMASPKVLDVGCGMSYATGNFIEKDSVKVPLDIHYIDPLADYYNIILRRHKRQLPDIEFGMAEYLSSFYPDHDVDMVIIQNALDHSARPLKSIFESLECLKKGGILYLNHHANEAETEKYKGFHKYNICDEDGRLILWNKEQKWDLAKELEGFAVIEDVKRLQYEHVIAVIRKTNDVPKEIIADKTDKQELCTLLIKQQMQNNSLWYAFCQKMTYWKYNTIQFIAQGLPWELKMGLKRLIKQA